MRFDKPLSIKDLLDIIKIDVEVKGNLDVKITGINEIHSVEPGNLSFVDHPKYYETVLNSVAGAVLINKEVDVPEGKAILVTDDPLEAFLQIVRHFVTFNPQKEAINTTAQIGVGTIIQPNVFIGENVKIGKNCIIHSNVSIYSETTIGDNVIIHSGAVLGADAYYFQRREEGWKKLESCGTTTIGNDVEIGCNVTIDKGVSGDTYIGDGTKFDNIVQVGHDTHIGARCLIGSESAIAGCTYIDDDCVIWAKSCVNKDLYVAKRTVILALSALDKDIREEGQVVFGQPAGDARKKWKEMAMVRRLPEIYEEFVAMKAELEKLKAQN